jgi:hypothetical protein
MKYFVLAMTLALTACSGDDKYTWGDAFSTISSEFCHFQAACNYFETEEEREQWTDYCIGHNDYHECDSPDSVCDVSLPDGSEENTDTCVEAMHQPEYAEDCVYAFYGVLPAECGPFWDMKPEPAE